MLRFHWIAAVLCLSLSASGLAGEPALKAHLHHTFTGFSEVPALFGGKEVEDAADQAGLADGRDHAPERAAARAEQRVDLVDPADEAGPSTA